MSKTKLIADIKASAEGLDAALQVLGGKATAGTAQNLEKAVEALKTHAAKWNSSSKFKNLFKEKAKPAADRQALSPF